MTSRERILAALDRKIPDRVPILELCFWDETIERWRGEGLPAGVTPAKYFELDDLTLFSFDGSLRLPELCREENGMILTTDADGVSYRRLAGSEAPPAAVSSLIDCGADWELYAPRLVPTMDRLSAEEAEKARRANREGRFCVLSPVDPCWYALRLLGEVDFLVATLEDTAFVRRLIADYARFNLAMLQQLLAKGYRPDAVWFFSDLCYKNGMLFSPAFYRECVLPAHREMFSYCRARGIRVVYHCDGLIRELLPLLVEAGIDCIQPMEARAGNDVRQYKKLYGDRIAFMGNISADTLCKSRETIEREIREKMTVAMRGGGYLFHSDHSIPPGVSFDNYAYAVELARRYGRYDK